LLVQYIYVDKYCYQKICNLSFSGHWKVVYCFIDILEFHQGVQKKKKKKQLFFSKIINIFLNLIKKKKKKKKKNNYSRQK